MDNPVVSVCITTYNHAKYIRQALDGILMQRTKFRYEILLGEDDSSDSTREICEGYAARYPDKIRLFLHDRKNVIYFNGKPTGSYNFVNNLKQAKGKYIALLEGDDYWTDPNKLQKQIDFLENNPHVAGCFHNTITVDDIGNKIQNDYFKLQQLYYDQKEALLFLRSSYATCSLVFRSSVVQRLPAWYLKRTSDFALDLLITEYGKFAYIPEHMGAYRIHKGGIWQGRLDAENQEEIMLRLIILYDYKKFRDLYRTELAKRIKSSALQVAIYYKKKDRSKYFRALINYIRFMDKRNLVDIKVLIGDLLFPSLRTRYLMVIK